MGDDSIRAALGEIVAVTIRVRCHCGHDAEIKVELESGDYGWVVPSDERYNLCENCETIIDAGYVLNFDPDEGSSDDDPHG